MNSSAPSPHLVRTALIQVAALLFLAAIPTGATSFFKIRWQAPPAVESISAAEAKKIGASILWIDVRNTEDFNSAHIDGALLFNEKEHDASLEAVLKSWNPNKKIVVYGAGIGSERAQRVALQLKTDLQSHKVVLLEGGWSAWPRK